MFPSTSESQICEKSFWRMCFGGQRGQTATTDPRSTESQGPSGQLWGWGEVGVGDKVWFSTPLLQCPYLPGSPSLCQWGAASLLPLVNRLLFSRLLTFTVKMSQAACAGISRTGWLDSPKKIWEQDKIVDRLGETQSGSERWAPALAHGINIIHKPLHPKEAIKIWMIPQETLDLAWPCLCTSDFAQGISQDWFSRKPEVNETMKSSSRTPALPGMEMGGWSS